MIYWGLRLKGHLPQYFVHRDDPTILYMAVRRPAQGGIGVSQRHATGCKGRHQVVP